MPNSSLPLHSIQPIVYINQFKSIHLVSKSQKKIALDSYRGLTFLVERGTHIQTPSSSRIGACQEDSTLVTRGYLSHTQLPAGNPMVPLSFVQCKRGKHPLLSQPPENLSKPGLSIGTIESPEIPPAKKSMDSQIYYKNRSMRT